MRHVVSTSQATHLTIPRGRGDPKTRAGRSVQKARRHNNQAQRLRCRPRVLRRLRAREGYLNARLHTAARWHSRTSDGRVTDGSVKLFASCDAARRRALRHHQRRARRPRAAGRHRGDAAGARPACAARPRRPLPLRHRRRAHGVVRHLLRVITWAQHDERERGRAASAAPGASDAAADAEVAALGLPADAADSPARRLPRRKTMTAVADAAAAGVARKQGADDLAKAMGLRFGASTGGAPPSADLATAQRNGRSATSRIRWRRSASSRAAMCKFSHAVCARRVIVLSHARCTRLSTLYPLPFAQKPASV